MAPSPPAGFGLLADQAEPMGRTGDHVLSPVGVGPTKAGVTPTLTALIERAPWHEAVTWRETWPHEYVFVKRDNQRPLMEAICKRLTDGEGVDGRFCGRSSTYLFIGEHKYWVMTPCAEMDFDSDDYIINRARLYRDRRDFVVE